MQPHVAPLVSWSNQGNVTCCSFGKKTGGVVAVGTEDGIVHIWDVQTTTGRAQAAPPSCRSTIPSVNCPVESIAFDWDEDQLIVGTYNGALKVMRASSDRGGDSLAGAHRTAVKCIACNPVDKWYFASGSMDATVKYWDTRQQQPLQALKGLHSAITCLAISPDGGRVVSGDEDGKLSIVDVRKWKVIGECSISSAVTSLRLHPLELFLAAGTADGLIHLINVGTPPAPTGMLKHSMSRPVWSVDLVPGPNQVDSLFSTSSDGLKLHQGTSLTGSYDFSWDGDVLESAYMECSGKVLFASAHRNEVRLWGCDANMVAQGGVSAHQVAPAPAAQPTARPAQSSGLVKVKPQKMIRKSKEVGHTSTRGHLIQNPRYRQDGVHGTLIELEPREALDLDLSRWRNADGRIPPTKTPRDQLVKELADTGGKMEVLLMRRLEAAKVIRTLWASGNRTAAIDHARKASEIDFGVGLDFLNLIVTQQKAKEMLALEQCVALLPLVMVTLMSGVDAGVLVAIRALRFLFNKFYSNVQRTLAGPKGVGVDLQHEDRVAAAGDASQKFADAKRSLRHVVSGSPAGDGAAAALVAEEGKQLLKDFESLDS